MQGVIDYLTARPEFCALVLFPLATAIANAFNGWFAARWPIFAAALQHGGWDPVGAAKKLLGKGAKS